MVYSAHSSEFLAAGSSRIAMQVAYNGRHYHGWQCQRGVVSVQERLEQALTKVAAAPIKVVCAGRTDTGVHASGQIVHFDTYVTRPMRAWTQGTNVHLPDDISVQWVKQVDENFHARFSAQSRRYVYVIYNHPMRPALLDKEVTWSFRSLDVDAMIAGAGHLLGTHDFTSFRAAQCQANSPVRTVYSLDVIAKERYILLHVHANAFLHHMIRNIAGVLMHVGAGRAKPTWVKDVLDVKDRRSAVATAPPYGLYFTGAHYPVAFALPAEVVLPHFL